MRAEKQLLLEEIKERIEQAPAMVLLSYKHLKPNQAAAFRDEFRKVGGNLMVCPKRVFVKAAETSGIHFNAKNIQGHLAVAFSAEDTVGATKVVYDFQGNNEDVVEVLGGRFDGQEMSPQDVKEIAKLPSRDAMRAQVIGTIAAPMQQTLSTFKALLTSIPHCLENKQKKEEESK